MQYTPHHFQVTVQQIETKEVLTYASIGEIRGFRRFCGSIRNRIGNVGKPFCFNEFHIARNNVKSHILKPLEPAWDFKA